MFVKGTISNCLFFHLQPLPIVLVHNYMLCQMFSFFWQLIEEKERAKLEQKMKAEAAKVSHLAPVNWSIVHQVLH